MIIVTGYQCVESVLVWGVKSQSNLMVVSLKGWMLLEVKLEYLRKGPLGLWSFGYVEVKKVTPRA